MGETIEGLDRERIARLRAAGRFFWIDLSLEEVRSVDLGELLSIPADAVEVLLSFDPEHSALRKFFADGRNVVFGFSCYLDEGEPEPGTPDGLRAIEAHVLVCGDFMLTLHSERVSLPARLAVHIPERRSEQYVVYAVLDAMVATAFDALYEVELTIDDLAVMSTDLRQGRVRMTSLRAISTRLSRMRRRFGAQRGLFERIGVEIARLEGLEADEQDYFDRIVGQGNRLVSAVDAAADAVATLIDLRLNETSYWLTVVATIFLPLTFITGFFGMNFGWMVGQVDTAAAFWLLGIGTPLIGVAAIWRLVVRGSPER